MKINRSMVLFGSIITEEEITTTTTTTTAPEVVEEVTPFYFSLIPIIFALKGKRGRMNKND